MAVVSSHEESMPADPGRAPGKPGSMPDVRTGKVRSGEARGGMKTVKTADVAAMTTTTMTAAAVPAAGECVRREQQAAERENCGQHKD